MGDYDQFATLLGRFPRLTAFRSFAALSAKTLLYMQAELVHLEAQLADIEQEDAYSADQETTSYRYSWNDLSKSSEKAGRGIQLQKVLEIRRKLQEYHAALLQYSNVQRLRRPKDSDLEFLREWLDRCDGGNMFLRDREADPWELSCDLVALSDRDNKKDALATWLSSRCLPWFHKRFGHRIKEPIADKGLTRIWEYPDEHFVLISDAACTVFSSLLPIVSTCVLYHLSDPGARLVSFIVFNVLCAFILAVIVNARKVEVFAATSAFAAVQVVFVGGVNFCLPSERTAS